MKRRDFLKVTLPLALAGRAAAAPAETPDLTFGVIADPQYADADPIGSRFYRNSLGKLEHAIADLNTRPLDFTVTLGDLIDRDFSSFGPVMALYGKLKSPHFPILGNHDFSVGDAEKEKVLAAIGMEKPYHSKVIKGWRFVFTDGTDNAIWRYPAADPRTTGAVKPHLNSGMGAEQMAWLEKEFSAAREAGQRVIVFNHYPAFPEKGPNISNSKEVVSLIAKYENVAAYMNGHHHAGNYGRSGSCHYVNFKGMVETEKESAYSVVKCFPDRLEIEGYGLEPDRSLAMA
jgi:3',5'-cyclic AMP phosphodiesterase CpdA